MLMLTARLFLPTELAEILLTPHLVEMRVKFKSGPDHTNEDLR